MSELAELVKLDHLPLCEEDSRYTKSFDCGEDVDLDGKLEDIYNFYDEYGFVVLRNIYNMDECEQTRKAMWDIIEQGNSGFKRDDPSTWNVLKSKGQYGLSIRGPSFHPTLVNNRYCIVAYIIE